MSGSGGGCPPELEGSALAPSFSVVAEHTSWLFNTAHSRPPGVFAGSEQSDTAGDRLDGYTKPSSPREFYGPTFRRNHRNHSSG